MQSKTGCEAEVGIGRLKRVFGYKNAQFYFDVGTEAMDVAGSPWEINQSSARK